MDRMREYSDLLRQLEEVPTALAYTVPRARAKARRARAGRFLGLPAAGLCSLLAAFTLMVNLSAPFALACGNIPLLKELAAAVAFNRSLAAAVAHNYTQSIHQQQTQNGITLGLEYAIVDQRQLVVFYTLAWDEGENLDAYPELVDENGARPYPYVSYGSTPGSREWEDYLMYTFDFLEGEVPGQFHLCFDVRGTGREVDTGLRTQEANAGSPWEKTDPPPILATFDFAVSIDPSRIAPGRTLPAGQVIELDGQQLQIDSVSVHPTHIKVDLEEVYGNTAQLAGLDFYAIDEAGNRYEKAPISYGTTYFLESSYFSGTHELTLYFTKATWLEEGREQITLDLTNSSTSRLPQGLSLSSVRREGEEVHLTWTNVGGASFSWIYADPRGGEHTLTSMGTSLTPPSDGQGAAVRTHYLVLPDYPWESVTLFLSANKETLFDPPISLPLT